MVPAERAEMKLTVLERLLLLQIMPNEGNLTTLRIVRDMARDLSFSEEEHAALNIQQENDAVTWNLGTPDKDVKLGPKAQELIRESLARLDEQGKLRLAMLDLCDKVGYAPSDDA